ncbi:hypothetical protein RM553_13200 [Zunongwangia sp. F363]|uniref:Uncharacterized protein n=1 Tax=Autumnicola tepida TaxID=3075595 RepID=A0ABU3CBS6_9FLAO|nr:hypothetical protein [Zunongwangia sp. F363]MDT0643793.1 hypothetical protein [Zunongwangia sp. F363]
MKTQNDSRCAESRRSTVNLAIWTAAWVLSLALVTFGARCLWDFNMALTILFILVNLATGVGMLVYYVKYLRNLDELQRKISMEAMGVTLGVAVVGGLAFSTLDVTNVISFDAEISYLVILIGISYIFSIAVANSRYK